MNLKTILQLLGTLFVLVGSVWGATAYFAKADDLKLVAMRLEQKIQGDSANRLQQNIWAFDDRYGVGCARCSVYQKKQYRRWKKELRELEEILREYRKKQVGG
jgi:hypothetical protein